MIHNHNTDPVRAATRVALEELAAEVNRLDARVESPEPLPPHTLACLLLQVVRCRSRLDRLSLRLRAGSNGRVQHP